MTIYVEPYPNEYWLHPGDKVVITGVPGTHEIEVIPFDEGMTVVFGEDPDPTVATASGTPIQPGHQQP